MIDQRIFVGAATGLLAFIIPSLSHGRPVVWLPGFAAAMIFTFGFSIGFIEGKEEMVNQLWESNMISARKE